MKINELFKKFYGMKPYLFIDEKDGNWIITTYDKDEVVDELVPSLHTYHVLKLLKRKYKSLKKLKGVKWGGYIRV